MAVTGKRPDAFAREHGIAKSTIYKVANRTMQTGKTTTRVRSLIAKTINLPQSDIWPDRTEGNT